MVNYAYALSQSEKEKYFEWIMINNKRRLKRRLKGIQVVKQTGQFYTFSLVLYYANSRNLRAYEI